MALWRIMIHKMLKDLSIMLKSFKRFLLGPIFKILSSWREDLESPERLLSPYDRSELQGIPKSTSSFPKLAIKANRSKDKKEKAICQYGFKKTSRLINWRWIKVQIWSDSFLMREIIFMSKILVHCLITGQNLLIMIRSIIKTLNF